ncbi:MAG TPA: dephospho-CoA kinase [Xanthobacteraceae bacterium]|nr:dephospho-CoA kinase [Xanthobacteraceae bacterium]
MLVLGLTGSIGMGKTTTARFFADEGVPVLDADAVVHQLYDGEAVAAIETAFPGTSRDGRIDREELSRRVVGNLEALKQLEAIVHPLVRAAQARFLADAERSGAPVAVLDVPLLFETGGERRVDAVVVVSAPADVQRARTLDRAGMTAEKFEALLQKQMPDDEKRRRADFVVDTSQSLDSARAQVRAILASVRAIRTRRDTDADA